MLKLETVIIEREGKLAFIRAQRIRLEELKMGRSTADGPTPHSLQSLPPGDTCFMP